MFSLSNVIRNLKSELDPTELRKAKIAYSFGLSECNRVKPGYDLQYDNNICSLPKKYMYLKKVDSAHQSD